MQIEPGKFERRSSGKIAGLILLGAIVSAAYDLWRSFDTGVWLSTTLQDVAYSADVVLPSWIAGVIGGFPLWGALIILWLIYAFLIE